ncbi:MAG: citrate synthase/methylcitrate synthase [Alphaproteobacteria bacterium]|nr:citrate synthase/methylcitrate synthase [Alphaproteobacteria bacterium]
MTAWIPGLEGVVAARTAVSRVDGEGGRLWFRGVPVETVGRVGFEGAAELVLGRPLVGLGEARVRAWERQRALTVGGSPMAVVRGRVASGDWSAVEDGIAEVAVAVAFAARADVPRPDAALDHASDLFRLARGRLPTEAERIGLSTYLATVMDHGLNASTFAARVVASTGSDAVSAVTAALGALKGPLHGGAPGPVLDMLDAVGSPERADAWVRAELDAGRRIMGMGHRVYRVRDPRAAALEGAVGGLHTDRLALARAVEGAAERALAARHPGRALRANVEFYTAILLEALGFGRELFTPLFAAGRVVGWLAHVEEERAVGRLLRPRAEYVGPPCT